MSSTPRLDSIYADLLSLAPRGPTYRAIADTSSLMTLEIARARASRAGKLDPTPERVAASILTLLKEAADRMSPAEPSGTDRGLAARALFGLLGGNPSDPRADRRARCAAHLGIKSATLTQRRGDAPTREETLIEQLAQALCTLDDEHQEAAATRSMDAHRTPYDTGLRVDWIRQFEAYYRLWTPADALRADLTRFLRDGAAVGDNEMAVNALYYLARFLDEVQRFVREHGGLWILPSRFREQRVADATYEIRRRSTFTDRERSSLARHYAKYPSLVDFVDCLDEIDQLVTKWRSFLATCECGRDIDTDCEVHILVDFAETFAYDLDYEWDALADWYTEERPEPLDQSVD